MKSESRVRTEESEMFLAFTGVPFFFENKTRNGPNVRAILGNGKVRLSSQWEKTKYSTYGTETTGQPSSGEKNNKVEPHFYLHTRTNFKNKIFKC